MFFSIRFSVSESISGSVSGFHLLTEASEGPHNPIRALAADPIRDDAYNRKEVVPH